MGFLLVIWYAIELHRTKSEVRSLICSSYRTNIFSTIKCSNQVKNILIMAIPSRQIGWSQKSNLLWQISKQLEYLTGVLYKGGTTTTTTTPAP